MKVVVLPMDNRPPNYRFLIDLAAIYNLEIVLPPRSKLGFYTQSGDVSWLHDWLLKQSGDAFLISSEMLCYGGLVASRETGVSLSEALRRLEILNSIKQKIPHTSIWVSSIIRRASITVSSAKTELLWSAFNQYLRSKSGDVAIPTDLDENHLKLYWQLRKRNHEVNKACIDLVAAGVIDLLVLAVEDTFPGGPHESELAALNQKILELNVQDKVYVHNGADEIMQELLVRLFNRGSIEIHFDSVETMLRVMDFEHQPFVRNVRSHVSLAGFTLNNDDSNVVLLIVGHDKKKGLEMLKQMNSIDKQVYLLDVFHANGADGGFVTDLLGMIKNSEFIFIKGFSAWNTASNRLGTLLAEAAMKKEKSDVLLLKFILERFVDDYLYQSVYRTKLEELLLTHGEDKYSVNLDSKTLRFFLPEFEASANKVLSNFEGKIFYTGQKPWILKSARIVSFELPWRRTFECEVIVDINVEPVSD